MFVDQQPKRLYTVLIVDDEWQARARDYQDTLGSACQIEFVKSSINIERFRNREYDAILVDLVLNTNGWMSGAAAVLDELRPSTGEFSGPVFLVTNAWSREDSRALSDQISRALNFGTALRGVLPWKMFAPDSKDADERRRTRDVICGLISLEINRWQGIAAFADVEGELRILHLFNLRFGASGHGDFAPMPAAQLAGALRRGRIGPHLIVVSGNLTESGQPSEFVRATDWLASLSSDLWSKDSMSARIFVAPGAHDVNRVLAIAGEYEFDRERGALRRCGADDTGRRSELGAFALAPFQRFATRFMGARQWGRLEAAPDVVFESRFRRFGIQIFGVSPGFDIEAHDRIASEAGRLLRVMEGVSARRDTVRLVIGEHGESLLPCLATEAPVSTRSGPLLLFLSAEGASGGARQAIDQPAVVVPGLAGESGARALNVVTVSPFERVTVQAYSCRNGNLVAAGDALVVALPAPDERGSSEGAMRAATPSLGMQSTGASSEVVREPTAVDARRVLLVTVTASERRAVLDTLRELNIDVEGKFSAALAAHEFSWPPRDPCLQVYLVRTVAQRGAEVAATIGKLIATHDFEAVLLVGMAMGVPGRVQVGDVVVPLEIVSVSHQRETSAGGRLIPHFYSPSGIAIRRMQVVTDSRQPFSFRVHTRQHACGDLKLEDPAGATVKAITDLSTDIYSYEMEAEGFFTALRDQHVEGLLIKGVADLADVPGANVEGAAAKADGQMRATANALSVALAFLDHLAQYPAHGPARGARTLE